MTIPQEDKLSMNYVVKNVCERYQATWTTNAVFAATYNLWVAKIPLIEANRDAQLLQTTGVTTDKKSKRTLMVEKAMFIENRIQSFANVTNNLELLDNVKYTPTDLKAARDTDIIGICNTILAKATANAAALVAYGVTAVMNTELQASITAYSTTLSKPSSAKSQTKTATENLAKLFKESDDLLIKRLDLDIEHFKVTKPEFYSQYKTARIIISTGTRSTSVMGNVITAMGAEPLKGVMFSFTLENGGMLKSATAVMNKPIVKKSADKGNFRIPSLPEGSYNVLVKKIGFKEQTLTINVAKGETTNLKVELEKN